MAIKKEEIPEGHAFVDNSERFPLDALLRKHGWKIVSRKEKDPIWEKQGMQAHQGGILATFSRQEVQQVTGKQNYRDEE